MEFLENIIKDMDELMFTEGTPIHSSHHVQSGNYRTCGEIAAVSLAPGGPPPRFLEMCSFEAIFTDTDMMNIEEKHLTLHKQKTLNDIRSDIEKYADVIIDNGYTGPIDNAHTEDSIRSLRVSMVSRRRLYMKKFAIGLDTYGLGETIRHKPEVCQPLFVIGNVARDLRPDADYLFSLMTPRRKEPQGETRRRR